jgi:hypothetical protein
MKPSMMGCAKIILQLYFGPKPIRQGEIILPFLVSAMFFASISVKRTFFFKLIKRQSVLPVGKYRHVQYLLNRFNAKFINAGSVDRGDLVRAAAIFAGQWFIDQ